MATLATRLPRRVAKDATGDSTSQNILRAKYVTYRHIFTYRIYTKMWRNKINIYSHNCVTLVKFLPIIESSNHINCHTNIALLPALNISINRFHKPYISYRPKYH